MTLTAAECLRSTATEWGSSRWGTRNKCGREYRLRYERKIFRLPMVGGAAMISRPTPFHVGSIVHAGIRLVESGSMASAAAAQAVADAAGLEGSRFSFLDIAEGVRLLESYWAHYGEENALAPGWADGYAITGTEIPLAATGLRHTGAVDTLLMAGDELIIADTKTRARKLPEDAARLFATNPQFLSLSYMAQEKWDLESPPPVIVNAIIKTKIPSFDRVLVRFTQAQVGGWACNQQLIEAQQERLGTDLAGAMNYNNCAPAIGSKCDYFYYCHGSNEERALRYGEGTAIEPEEAA